jgi:hypothetical protein
MVIGGSGEVVFVGLGDWGLDLAVCADVKVGGRKRWLLWLDGDDGYRGGFDSGIGFWHRHSLKRTWKRGSIWSALWGDGVLLTCTSRNLPLQLAACT